MVMILRKLRLIPRILLTAGANWPVEYFSPKPERHGLWSNWWGINDPALEPIWQRLFAALDKTAKITPDDPNAENVAHCAKDVLTEWCRLNAQRAGKALAFTGMVWTVFTITLDELVHYIWSIL